MINYVTIFLLILTTAKVNAQLKVSILTSPFSVIARNKILVPLGVELQSSDRWSFYAEISLPYNRSKKHTRNGDNVVNIKAQLRAYSQKIKIDGLLLYSTFEIERFSFFYSEDKGVYINKSKRIIRFGSANVGHVINSISFKMGGKLFLARRFIFDFNIGFGLSQEIFEYYNVSTSVSPIAFQRSSFDEVYLQGRLSSQYKVMDGSTIIPSFRGCIRIGYLLN